MTLAAADPFGVALHLTRHLLLLHLAERLAQFIDGDAEAVIEVDRCVGPPQPLLQGFPRDNLAGMLKQHGQQLEGLTLQPYPDSRPIEFTGLQIGFEDSELDAVYLRAEGIFLHD